MTLILLLLYNFGRQIYLNFIWENRQEKLKKVMKKKSNLRSIKLTGY